MRRIPETVVNAIGFILFCMVLGFIANIVAHFIIKGW